MEASADLYLNYLREEGYVPSLNESGDVVFKFQGATFVISVDEQDTQFFRLIFPNFWAIDTDEELAKALRTANQVNFMMKVGKILIVENNVWSVVELLLDSTPELSDVVPRALHIARQTAEEFGGAMRMSEITKDLPLN